MTDSNNAANGLNKTPSIVTWISVLVAIPLTLINLGTQNMQAGEAIGFFVTNLFFNFLIAYFPLWLLASFALRSLRVQKKNLMFNSLICVAGTIIFLAVGTAFTKAAENDGDAIAGNSQTAQNEAEKLPKCDSRQAQDGIKSAIEDNALRNVVSIKLLDMYNLAEISYNNSEGVRRCVGDLVLNTGRATIEYVLSESKSEPGSFLIELNEVEDFSRVIYLRNQAAEHAKSPEQKELEIEQAKERRKVEEEERSAREKAKNAQEERRAAFMRCLQNAEQRGDYGGGVESLRCNARYGSCEGWAGKDRKMCDKFKEEFDAK